LGDPILQRMKSFKGLPSFKMAKYSLTLQDWCEQATMRLITNRSSCKSTDKHLMVDLVKY